MPVETRRIRSDARAGHATARTSNLKPVRNRAQFGRVLQIGSVVSSICCRWGCFHVCARSLNVQPWVGIGSMFAPRANKQPLVCKWRDEIQTRNRWCVIVACCANNRPVKFHVGIGCEQPLVVEFRNQPSPSRSPAWLYATVASFVPRDDARSSVGQIWFAACTGVSIPSRCGL